MKADKDGEAGISIGGHPVSRVQCPSWYELREDQCNFAKRFLGL